MQRAGSACRPIARTRAARPGNGVTEITRKCVTQGIAVWEQLGKPNQLMTAGPEFAFAYDLNLDEVRRRSAVLDAFGDDWDPAAVLAEEERAWDMLYSDRDADQQRIYDDLVSAGVLPRRAVDHVAD
jgi:Family of unknown function (DUF6400)